MPQTVYFYMKQKRIIGVITIRHTLNDWYLKYGGQIGYTIRPSERNKGYATMLLKEGLKVCKNLNFKKVLLCCDKKNIYSAKTITNNNGILENEVQNDFNGKIIQRYWIML